MAESVWATLKTSVLRPEEVAYPGGGQVEGRRLHFALGYVPPVEFEMNLLNKPAAEEPEAA